MSTLKYALKQIKLTNIATGIIYLSKTNIIKVLYNYSFADSYHDLISRFKNISWNFVGFTKLNLGVEVSVYMYHHQDLMSTATLRMGGVTTHRRLMMTLTGPEIMVEHHLPIRDLLWITLRGQVRVS